MCQRLLLSSEFGSFKFFFFGRDPAFADVAALYPACPTLARAAGGKDVEGRGAVFGDENESPTRLKEALAPATRRCRETSRLVCLHRSLRQKFNRKAN